jgi:prevent-host-death family protein
MKKKVVTVGIFEAKTHLSSIIDRVIKGEEVLITKRGVEVARIAPVKEVQETENTIEDIRQLSLDLPLGFLSQDEIAKLKEEGRE